MQKYAKLIKLYSILISKTMSCIHENYCKFIRYSCSKITPTTQYLQLCIELNCLCVYKQLLDKQDIFV